MDTVIELNQEKKCPLKEHFQLSIRALTQPSRFFRQDLPHMETNSVLALGIANGWAAAACAFFMQTVNSLLLSQLLDRWMQRLLSSEDGFAVWALSPKSFLFTSGSMLLAPFLLLLQVYIDSTLLYVFARLLIEDRPGAPETVTYKGAMRIQGAALVSNWYSLVPIFGGILSFYVSLVLTVTGVRERFGVSNRRAAAVVLAPYILAAMFALLIGAMLTVAATQLPLSELLDIDPKQLGI